MNCDAQGVPDGHADTAQKVLQVHGHTVDDHNRCIHWRGPLDIVAIQFKCCGLFFPCRECHDANADHTALLWAQSDANEHAVLCGACKGTISISDYLNCGSECPNCGAGFNPGCSLHRNLYFEF